LRFSNNGKYLATGSKDMTVIIWKIEVCQSVSLIEITVCMNVLIKIIPLGIG